jgi:outer membrane protein TolC
VPALAGGGPAGCPRTLVHLKGNSLRAKHFFSSRILFPALAVGLLAGCGEGWYRRWADEEVYAVLQEKQQAEKLTLPRGEAFRVEQEPLELASIGILGSREDLAAVPAPEPVRAPVATDDAGDGAAPASAEEAEAPLPPFEGDAAAPAEDEGAPGGDDGEQAPEGEPEEETGAPPGAADPQGAEAGEEPAAAAPAEGGEAAAPSLAELAPRLPARILTLEEALRLAFANNREYQSSRESVYLSALALTLARYDFAPRFFGAVAGDWFDSAGDQSGRINTVFGVNWILATGARLSLSALNNFAQFFTGDRRELAETIFRGTLSQPLLRGFGSEVVLEPLVQAERNVVYQIRAFERFRQSFAVRVVSEYYRALQARDRVSNEYNNWRGLVTNRDRATALAQAGRLAVLEVDQADQQELQAKDRYFAAVQRNEAVLDQFKITLGIPIGESISLDQRELDRLVERGVPPLEVELADAIEVAVSLRLDLLSERDQVEDAARRVRVRADALRAQLDVDASVSLPSGSREAQKPLEFNTGRLAYGFGFDLDLPLDRKAERNAYVAARIAYERENREYSLFEDSVRLTVRDAYRTLEREMVGYPIQERSVELAESRVASTNLLRDAGRAQTRDVLESQSALVEARNALTGSLVNYTIARLEFYRDTGALSVDDDGRITELAIEPRRND